jgi:hypothetical protein
VDDDGGAQTKEEGQLTRYHWREEKSLFADNVRTEGRLEEAGQAKESGSNRRTDRPLSRPLEKESFFDLICSKG